VNFCFGVRSKVTANGLGLCEVADFLHKLSIEAPKFKFSKIVDTKHFTRSLAKPML
jgi:hypothetical protein